MLRTQIYLTEEERAALRNLARETGKKQSALIRRAIDAFIERFQPRERAARWRRPGVCGRGEKISPISGPCDGNWTAWPKVLHLLNCLAFKSPFFKGGFRGISRGY